MTSVHQAVLEALHHKRCDSITAKETLPGIPRLSSDFSKNATPSLVQIPMAVEPSLRFWWGTSDFLEEVQLRFQFSMEKMKKSQSVTWWPQWHIRPAHRLDLPSPPWAWLASALGATLFSTTQEAQNEKRWSLCFWCLFQVQWESLSASSPFSYSFYLFFSIFPFLLFFFLTLLPCPPGTVCLLERRCWPHAMSFVALPP